MSLTRPRKPFLASAVLLTALAASSLVQAQPQDRGGNRGQGRGGWGGMMMGGGFGGGRSLFEPEFRRADMPILVGVLALDDAQTMIAEALLLDYESAFLEAMDEARNSFESDEGLDASMRQRQEQRREMRDRFRAVADDLRAQRERDGEIDEATMQAVREQFESMRAEMTALRPTEGEMSVLRDRFSTLGKQWQQERLALRSLFVANMMAVLTEPQLPDWARFERHVRRRHSLGRGMLSAERVDLLIVLNEMGVGEGEREAFGDLLESYEIELDTALIARNTYLDEDRQGLFDAMRAGDTATTTRLLREESRLRLAVRDVNESYAQLLTELLRDRPLAPGEAGFEDRYLERAFPRIYGPTAMERTFDAIRRFDDIPPEFLEPILGLEDSYLVELDSINGRLLTATRAHEAEQIIQRFERRGNRASSASGQPESTPDPIGAIRTERSELDQRYRRQIESVLTEDQIDALPSMRNEQRRWGGFRGGQDGQRVGGNGGERRGQGRGRGG